MERGKRSNWFKPTKRVGNFFFFFLKRELECWIATNHRNINAPKYFLTTYAPRFYFYLAKIFQQAERKTKKSSSKKTDVDLMTKRLTWGRHKLKTSHVRGIDRCESVQRGGRWHRNSKKKKRKKRGYPPCVFKPAGEEEPLRFLLIHSINTASRQLDTRGKLTWQAQVSLSLSTYPCSL